MHTSDSSPTEIPMTPVCPLSLRHGLTLALACALVACATPAPPPPSDPALERRMTELERRIEALELRPAIAPPYRDKAEIQAHIESLEAERAELLSRYLPQHPAIRDLDRRLAILNVQLEMFD
jgi:hypothetical protein